MQDALERALSDLQSDGNSVDQLIDPEWLIEDGNEAAFMIYYFPNDFMGPEGNPSWEPINQIFIDHLEQNPEAISLLPGGHGKSTSVLRYMIMLMCREPQIAMIYIEKTQPEARKRAHALMQQLEGNALLRAHYGDFKGSLWSTDALTIKQRPTLSQWPTVSFFGAGGQGGLGNRCNVLFVDDPVTQENSGSELERANIWRWWTQAASTCPYPLPIKKERYLKRTSLSGTTFHLDDLYHQVLRRQPNFKQLHLRAVNDDNSTLSPRFWYEEPEQLKRRATVDEEAAHVEKLIDKGRVINIYNYRKMSTAAFMRRYQNQVTDPDLQIFPEVWFTGGRDEMAPPEGYPGCYDKSFSLGEDRKPGWRYVTGIDPAAGLRTQASVRFACVTLAMDPENPQYTYLVDLEYGQYPLDSDAPSRRTQINAVLDQAQEYQGRIVLETNNIQGVYDGVLRKAAQKRGMVLSVTGHTTTKQKKQDTDLGIEAMAAMVENGFLRLPAKQPSDLRQVEELVTEMTLYGVNPTDDILMAFWFGWRVLERFRTRRVVRAITPDQLADYMLSAPSYDFPPGWTEEQRMRYLGLEPEEEDQPDAVEPPEAYEPETTLPARQPPPVTPRKVKKREDGFVPFRERRRA